MSTSTFIDIVLHNFHNVRTLITFVLMSKSIYKQFLNDKTIASRVDTINPIVKWKETYINSGDFQNFITQNFKSSFENVESLIYKLTKLHSILQNIYLREFQIMRLWVKSYCEEAKYGASSSGNDKYKLSSSTFDWYVLWKPSPLFATCWNPIKDIEERLSTYVSHYTNQEINGDEIRLCFGCFQILRMEIQRQDNFYVWTCGFCQGRVYSEERIISSVDILNRYGEIIFKKIIKSLPGIKACKYLQYDWYFENDVKLFMHICKLKKQDIGMFDINMIDIDMF